MKIKITVLVDNLTSWIIPFAQKLCSDLINSGHSVFMIHNHNEVSEGDILCLLSCEKKFKSLHLNKHNLVVHESDLPLGRGMSPFTWQIVEGSNDITISLLEATDQIDAGVIYEKIKVPLDGTELVDEWRELQANATCHLIKKFVSQYPNNVSKEQIGVPTYYRSRNRQDSRIDINKSIKEQFNLLRVVDNERYPAWFEINGVEYELKINSKRT